MITVVVIATGDFALVNLTRANFAPQASVTEHPVELGSEVTDHVQKRPLPFDAEVFVSDSPLVNSPVTLRNTREATAFFEGSVGELCNVTIDGEGVFNNYVLEGVLHSRTQQGGRSYTLRFKQLRIASALSVQIPARQPAPVAEVGAPTEVPLGQQATVPADAVPESTAYAAAAALLGG
jgi:hypothetical protein